MVLLRMLAFRPGEADAPGGAPPGGGVADRREGGKVGAGTTPMSTAGAKNGQPIHAESPVERELGPKAVARPSAVELPPTAVADLDLEAMGPAARRAARLAAPAADTAASGRLEPSPSGADTLSEPDSMSGQPAPAPAVSTEVRSAPAPEVAQASDDDDIFSDDPSESDTKQGSSQAEAEPVQRAPDEASAKAPDRTQPEAEDVTLAPPIARSEPAVEQQWYDLVRELGVSGVTQVLASHCYLVGDAEGVVHLRIEKDNATLWNKSHEKRIGEALGKRLGGRCQIDVTIGPVPGDTPAAIEARERAKALERAVEDIEGNDNIQALLTDFDGTLIRESIEPRAE